MASLSSAVLAVYLLMSTLAAGHLCSTSSPPLACAAMIAAACCAYIRAWYARIPRSSYPDSCRSIKYRHIVSSHLVLLLDAVHAAARPRARDCAGLGSKCTWDHAISQQIPGAVACQQPLPWAIVVGPMGTELFIDNQRKRAEIDARER